MSAPQSVPAQPANGARISREAFAGRIAAELERRSPNASAVIHADDYVELWHQGAAGAGIPVGPTFAAYWMEPARAAELVSQAAEEALRIHALASDWAEARVRLYPQLVSFHRFRALDDLGGMPVHLQLSDQVFLILELRLAAGPYVVHRGMQVIWQQSSADMFEQAVKNLNAATPDLVQSPDGSWRFPVEDRYQAVRVLLTDRFAPLIEQVQGPLAIAIPSASIAWVFDASDPHRLANMKRYTEAEFLRAEEPLTLSWLSHDGERLTLYQPDRGYNGA